MDSCVHLQICSYCASVFNMFMADFFFFFLISFIINKHRLHLIFKKKFLLKFGSNFMNVFCLVLVPNSVDDVRPNFYTYQKVRSFKNCYIV